MGRGTVVFPIKRPNPKDVAIGIIKAYQIFVSPLFGPTCRFYPSCSNYAIESIKVYGLMRGILHAVKRILKCHPLHPGGYDPVQ